MLAKAPLIIIAGASLPVIKPLNTIAPSFVKPSKSDKRS